MIEKGNPVLAKMLDRLFAAMVNGPAMNCRPYASRQRIDLAQFNRLKDLEPASVLLTMIGQEHAVKLAGRVPVPAKTGAAKAAAPVEEVEEISPEERAARQAWSEQQALLSKIRVIADDARTYEQDTGAHALNIGFPLLSLPPGSFGGRTGVASRRILAPIAFIPISLTMKSGAKPIIEMACRGQGVDLVVPNIALLAWLEQQTGQSLISAFDDEQGKDPWREIAELVRLVAKRIDIPTPDLFTSDEVPPALDLGLTPKADQDGTGPSIVTAAVLGLFPTSNQALLNDTREMVASGISEGPIESFVRHGASIDGASVAQTSAENSIDGASVAQTSAEKHPIPAGHFRNFSDERLVTVADPCQTRAVRLARQARGLVIHGPPGTGKSQTIANVIGDHLAHGERVLFVCDKRTALDVVADRLNTLNLGDLCATIHDPQRDQRELYRSVREQLDQLADATLKPDAAAKLAKIDSELQVLHDELSAYYKELMGQQGGAGSFHHLVGQWLGETGDGGNVIDAKQLQSLEMTEFDKQKVRLKEVLDRGELAQYANNPWKTAVGLDLTQFLSNPMEHYRQAVDRCRVEAVATDATFNANLPPFDAGDDLLTEGERRRQLADQLDALKNLPMAAGQFWARQDAPAVQSAQKELLDAAAWRAEVVSFPIDPALAQKRPSDFSAAHAGQQQAALTAYIAEFESRGSRYAQVRRSAPDVESAAILKWMAAEPKLLASAPKRLEAAAPLADAIEASSLDVSLLGRFDAAPLDSSRIFESLASLNGYLDIAGKWNAIFHSGRKKAAEPVVKHFGLSLNPSSAAQVKQFLGDFQKRVDLQKAIETATPHRFDGRPDDTELLTAYKSHRAVASALSGSQPASDNGAVAAPADDATIAAINELIATEFAAAQEALTQYGLPFTPDNARRLAKFLHGTQCRSRLGDLLKKFELLSASATDTPDAELLSLATLCERLFELLAKHPSDSTLGIAVAKVLSNSANAAEIITALRQAPMRAAAISTVGKTLLEAGIFSKSFLKAVSSGVLANKLIAKPLTNLADRLDTLEAVIRVREGLARLPKELATAAGALLSDSCSSATGFSAIRRNVLAGEIARRLAACPNLQTVDGHRLKMSFDRYRYLSEFKKEVVRDAVQHHWVSRQRNRLLAGTGTRLNSVAADLRRRLTTKGDKAMRLRQVIAHGAALEGGDPLFDLRPIWMASPETVAQLFPRQAIFDVVIFDEASQCRLEEALPVLARAKRVVIAGDPRQLPPTRFFESAVVTSDDMDTETDQELFEAQQGDIEDLLTAALGLDVHQCYLDVHYRSRNSDLIGFSNAHFYSSRLQAIPGHPKNRARFAPITLYRAEGIYEKRKNVVEAEAVCKIVRDLLKRAAPPSIGIACFNMVQRDLIVEKLEEMAERDDEFAARLAEARERRGPNSSEGLFVKNLENVQGDERDHLVISTTYGPDPTGKFRRNFGPLGNAGGGRRLNVLVTRARQELHIVTSIPKSLYAALPELPPGTSPSGAWLLFAYLAYAEQLQQEYETNHRILQNSGPAEKPSVNVRNSRTPSQFAKSLATKLAVTSNHGSDVYWGNEGFSVDLAMQHPERADDVTIGVLCDMTRYTGSDDPVEWDVFRTAVHESQGWRLHRVWTPHFFRDSAGAMKEICASVEKTLQDERAASHPAQADQ